MRRFSYPGPEQLRTRLGSAPLTPFAIAEGRPPQEATDVVLERTLAETTDIQVGDQVRVLALGKISEYRVSGIAAPAEDASWRYQSALFFEDRHAWELWELAPDRAGAIGVLPAQGVTPQAARDAVGELLLDAGGGRYRALTGAERGEAEQNISAEADRAAASSIFMLLVWTAVVSTGVVAGAIGLAVRGRGREIAVLRAVGAAPRQVRLMVAGEALVLSLAALALGLPLGALIAEGLATGGLSLGGGFSPAYRVHVTLPAILVAAVFVLVSAQVSGRSPHGTPCASDLPRPWPNPPPKAGSWAAAVSSPAWWPWRVRSREPSPWRSSPWRAPRAIWPARPRCS
ncbi:FtsX-like permease family protein [Nocardiopsis sp. ARC36]